MRQAFAQTLVGLAEQDRRILLLTGDLGFLVLDNFAKKFPDRFFNIGVAEQNMVGIATGFAEAGYIPFVYSIAPFASLRPYEFIRNGPVRHRLPVRIVGVGGGFDYGNAGFTHHGLDDVGVMRIQPGLTLVVPADQTQTRSALMTTWNLPGPVYYRLGKDSGAEVPGLEGRFELGRAQRLGDGADLLFVVMGGLTNEALGAAQILEGQQIHSSVMVVSSLNPAPTSDLVSVLSQYKLVLTIEGHYITGGIGSLVSEVTAQYGLGCRVVRCGVRDAPNGISGSLEYMNHIHGLSRAALATTAVQELSR